MRFQIIFMIPIVVLTILAIPVLASEEIEVIEFDQYTTGFGDDLPYCQGDVSSFGQCRCMSETAHDLLDKVFLEGQMQAFCNQEDGLPEDKRFADICKAFNQSVLDPNQPFTYEGLPIQNYLSRIKGS